MSSPIIHACLLILNLGAWWFKLNPVVRTGSTHPVVSNLPRCELGIAPWSCLKNTDYTQYVKNAVYFAPVHMTEFSFPAFGEVLAALINKCWD